MYNYLFSIKDAFIKRFGPVLGYPLMVICLFVTLTVIIYIIRLFFSAALGFLIAFCILFGIYRLNEVIHAKKK